MKPLPFDPAALAVAPSAPLSAFQRFSVSAFPSPSPSAAVPDQTFTLPDGTPLLLTLMVEAHVNTVFAGEANVLSAITTPHQAFVLLWMCAHPPAEGTVAVWEVPGHSLSGDFLPLYLRATDLISTAVNWFSRRFAPGDCLGFMVVANALWNHHKAAEVIPDPNPGNGSIPEKKNPEEPTPTPSINSSTSSPEATPPCATTSFTECPSGNVSPPATAISSASDSPASPPPNAPPGGDAPPTE